MLIISLPACAQYQLKGKVMEASNQPAAYATLALMSPKDSSIVKGGLSDETGNFIFEGLTSGDYMLTVQYVGYKTRWLPVVSLGDASPSLELGEILLESKIENLQEVTITGQKSLVENLGDKMVLNVANSVIAKGNKVDDLLKYAPMVSMSPAGIKVGSKDNVLILIDGRQTSKGSLDNFLQSFSAEQILKIEVISNPSAKYDASFGAVVNIITKKSLERGINGRAGIIFSQGKYARSNPDLSLNFRSARWSVFTTVNGRLNNVGSDEATLRKYQQGNMEGKSFSFFKTYDLSTFSGIDYFAGANHTLGLRFNSGWQKTDTKTDGTTYFKSSLARTDSVLLLKRLENDRTENYDANFYYTGKLDRKGKEISVNLTRSYFDRSNTQNLNYRYMNSELAAIRLPQNLRIRNPKDEQNLIAKADLSLPTKSGGWQYGFQLTTLSNNNSLTQQNQLPTGEYTVDTSFTNQGKYKERSYAGYMGFNTKLKSGWALQTALRYEWTHQELLTSNLKRTYSGLFPSLSLNKSFKSNRSFRVSYTRKIQRPTLSTLVPYRYQLDPYLISEGNPLVKPSFAHTLDANFTTGGLTLFANFTNTHNAILNTVFFDPASKIYTVSFTNLKRMQSQYLGLSWGRELRKWWSLNWNAGVRASQTNSPVGEFAGGNLTGAGFQTNVNNILTLPNGYKAELLLVYESASRNTINKSKQIFFSFISFNKALGQSANVKVIFRDVFHTQLYRYVVSYGNVSSSNQYYNDNQRIQVALTYSFGKKTVKQARDKGLGNDAEKGRMGGGVK
ncbi:outer membrane beta-barrel family protein [Dyadobacter sp. CY356]|uniref:outer membrane beta-barrel family protein n=1 Tax=Dyadobacter sp. CY356 TaxID=2906442 RepID=UPI001F19F778|nr:outer membrane beta-barrel family protein [Dyadobacter sp. CY356]MCF0057133.1 TonB-dependent receptor [Dyadobacter sp. CY356]